MTGSIILDVALVVLIIVVWRYFPRALALSMGLAYVVAAQKTKMPSGDLEGSLVLIAFIVSLLVDSALLYDSQKNKKMRNNPREVKNED